MRDLEDAELSTVQTMINKVSMLRLEAQQAATAVDIETLKLREKCDVPPGAMLDVSNGKWYRGGEQQPNGMKTPKEWLVPEKDE